MVRYERDGRTRLGIGCVALVADGSFGACASSPRSRGMNLEQTPVPATLVAEWQDTAAVRLHGPWLILARMLWLAIFLLTFVVFCANLVVGHYGLVPTIVLVTSTSVWFAVSLLLFWRKSSDWAVLVFSLLL